MTDDIEWVEVPQRTGGGRGPVRRASATLHRNIQSRDERVVLERLMVAESLLDAIGAPVRVDLVVDKSRGRLALRPSDTGRLVCDREKQGTSVRICVTGLSEALGLPGRSGAIQMRAAIKKGMVLMEPIAPLQPCTACGGRGAI